MRFVDFDIHGLFGLRWINPPSQVEAAGDRLLGILRGPLPREPDLTYRFVDRLPAPGLRLLGQHQYGFTEDAFFIFPRTRTGAKAKIPFDRLGTPCEIICEMGVDEAPLLIELIRVLALNKGCVPIHASAFAYQGQTFLVSSWAKGGKTTALLGFLALGAEFIADDLVLLSGDGEAMYGIPTPIEVSPRHLAVMPSLRQRMRISERMLIAGLDGLGKIRNSTANLTSGTSLAARVWQKTVSAFERKWCVHMSPDRAFGKQLKFCAPAPGKIFILMSQEGASIEVEPARHPDTVSRLVVASLQEQKTLAEHYRAFKFAFPSRVNPFIERSRECHRDILSRALRGKEVFIVRHPNPLQFPNLYEALHQYCEPTAGNFLRASSREGPRRNETSVLRSAS
jgi:hypothetical protein